MNSYTLSFREIDITNLAVVGGKGANLGELCKLDGISVPEGFCVTTEAFKNTVGQARGLSELLDRLAKLTIEDLDKVQEVCKKIRHAIEGTPIDQDIVDAITDQLGRLGEKNSYAVRSSATAEDLPTASFAGQQDTYLNIIGREEILKHVSKCWASLFTYRAVIYRMQNGFDHRKVQLAVVIQKMIFPDSAGIMFTADPVTSNRKVVSIDASFGLGEALVSGLVNPDVYKVSNGKIIDKKISTKKLAIVAGKDGGTGEQQIDSQRQTTPALTEAQIVELESIGRKIEQHFGRPQDIEWCLVDDTFLIVQSRPITSLFPIPETNDQQNHLYVSVGHQQMMTDPMKPLGLSFFLLMTTAPMRTAAGRLFVDVAPMLASPDSRQALMNTLGKSDPLIKDAFLTILERDDFFQSPQTEDGASDRARKSVIALAAQPQIEDDPQIVSDLIELNERSIADLREKIETRSGPELFDFILQDIQDRRQLAEQNLAVIMTAMNASAWLNEKMQEWLGVKSVADTLTQSVPNNITSEMGLALLDVADVIRPFPGVIDYLSRRARVEDENFLTELAKFEGGQEARDAIQEFLHKYGMRCVGEIDITRTRWSEKPATLIPLILSNVKNFKAGAGSRKFEQGRAEAMHKQQELLERLKQLPDGEAKSIETGEKISLIRNFSGYREYPKYVIVQRLFLYKHALLKEAERLVQADVICEREDIFYLTFPELREVVLSNQVDHKIISRRKDEYKSFGKLTPPRVITSDGEIIAGEYKRENLPSGALVGLAVSSGVVEGRARVILSIENAELEDGDILVTTFTDPSWTPLFVSIKGLVTEVGGLMTHGAVIAREYGLPAVVGVEKATKLIKDGQRIRVNGTEGYVEVLP